LYVVLDFARWKGWGMFPPAGEWSSGQSPLRVDQLIIITNHHQPGVKGSQKTVVHELVWGSADLCVPWSPNVTLLASKHRYHQLHFEKRVIWKRDAGLM